MHKFVTGILFFLLAVLNGIADSLLAWVLPRWRRTGNELAARLSHTLHHFKPEIAPERRKVMQTDIDRLHKALLLWRRGEVQHLDTELREKYLETSFQRPPSWVESLESIVVVLVVLLGLRAYYIQPFRIPTNSMWPSLNGIVVHAVDEIPSLPRRAWDKITLGSTYVDVKADRKKRLLHWRDERYALLFTRTILEFDDGSQVELPASSGTVLQYLRERGKIAQDSSGALFAIPFDAGETIMRARIDAGDMVLADRVSYQFRLPKRGETFVFDTRGINTSGSRQLRDQAAATHYIKRLCALPGDSVSIRSPLLFVNERPATEVGIARVEAALPPYRPEGYHALSPVRVPGAFLTIGSRVQLARPVQHFLGEYLALGDNTTNSLDSRYWGPVRQFNVLGPACFTLWPFTSHWGSID